MPDLKSSALARAEYDEATAVLTVWFAGSGEVWDHYAVPRAVYDALIAAEAPGRVFTATIRDRYPASGLTETKESGWDSREALRMRFSWHAQRDIRFGRGRRSPAS